MRRQRVRKPVDEATLRAKVVQARTDRFLADVKAEAARARAKFPETPKIPGRTTAALVEEVGELFNALLEHQLGVGGIKTKTVKTATDVYKEAIQVANMALILATQGDAAFPYSMEQVG